MASSIQHPVVHPVPALVRVVRVVLAAACASGCGQSVSSTDAALSCALPQSAGIPPDPDAGPPTGSEVVFALGDLRLRTDAQGNADPTAWRRLGYDIDCRTTTAASTDVCQPADDGSVTVDGDEGRDNAYGAAVAGPMSDGFDAGESIASGDWTLLFRFAALDDGARRSAVAVEIAEGGPLGHPPVFDGSDVWPSAPATALQDGYVADSSWVSGSPITVRLRLAVEGEPFYLALHHAVFTARFSTDLSAAGDGQLAGIIDPAQLDAENHRVAALLFAETCVSLPEPLHTAKLADILLDGRQDPSATCDGISFGAGFDLRRVLPGPATSAPVPTPDPCPSPLP